jgi:hypothetical protein
MITKLQDSSVQKIAAGASAIEYNTPEAIIAGGIEAYQSGGLLGLFKFAVMVAKLLLAP